MTEKHKSHGEHHHKEKKKEHSTLKVKKEKIWKITAAIFGLFLVISVFTNGFNLKKNSGVGGSISAQSASVKAVDYINNYLLEPGITASLISVKEEGNLYNVQMDIGGRIYDSYMTKDGRLLFPSAVDLEDTGLAPPTQVEQPQQARTAPSVDMADLIDDDEVKGSANAPIVIVEFSDYECPFCTRFYQNTLPQLEEKYIKTGKVKFVYRDFPLSFHRNAQKAAEAAECAGEQGKYYEMHDKLFEEGVSSGVSSFKGYAKDIGLDTAKFDDCLDSGKMESEVQKDFQDGQASGVSGTPAFFVNGQFVSGAQPFEAFEQIIEGELAK